MLRVALVPLDDRPCHTGFAERLAELGRVELLLPPRAALGRFLTPGDPEAVLGWLRDVAPLCDACAVCVDMAVYGGLVASRTPVVPTDVARSRLDRLGGLLGEVGGPTALGSVLMRGTITVASGADAALYRDLARYSELAGLPRRTRPAAEWEELLARIPSDVRERYHAVRERNHAVNLACVGLVGSGLAGHVCFAQEDCRPVGLHRREQDAILAECRLRGLDSGQYSLHPGADELSCALLARLVLEARHKRVRLRTRILPDEAASRAAPFEDRPIRETLAGQMHAVGAEATSDPSSPLLLVVGPLASPVDLTGDDYAPAPSAGLEAPLLRRPKAAVGESWIGEVAEAVASESGPVGLADCAVANGGYLPLARRLREDGLLDRLCLHDAWNTAGNTLGTAVAFLAVAAALERLDHPVLRAFLLERRLDDIVYQSVVRSELEAWLRERGQDPNNLGEDERPAQEWLREHLVTRAEAEGWIPPGLAWEVRLPWPRTFECEVRLAAPTGG